MNLPNKLTIIRVVMIPFFVFFLLSDLLGGAADWTALIIFVVASLTDLLDGHIARKHNLVTNFGKFMDPLADKLLVSAAMICLVELGRLPAWIVVIIISREFIISGFRLIASDNGVVIAASYWGKFKTTFQMIMICLLIADIQMIRPVTAIVTAIALILTVVSLVDYIIKNKNVMKEDVK
ncbi:MAG: CDP-diacylglycerol--glycerol-3-phosphate 3-phosphatidyltransferase [Lachnospiraceae bacterium]|nr:CDP-diacylglycerol--glycerol-3-phosphate 3-phosphatidyltransferase [Lachnospiraceae bacterium]MDD3659126.1 CDP-diacylglycerol--glycerol-3-phosphate 3-phosphatidyltransferase [Lachnospiraceae bacterium]